MATYQYERDIDYLAALAVFKGMHQSGILSESELIKLASFLAESFSPSPLVKTLEFA